MLSPRFLSPLLMLLAGGMFLYFSSSFFWELWKTFPLQGRAEAKIVKWEVEEREGKYALTAHYLYEVQGKIWKSRATLSGPFYESEWAAIAALKEKARAPWRAWYEPRNPSHSALEKSFPLGGLVKTLICAAVFLYFYFLRKRVLKISSP